MTTTTKQVTITVSADDAELIRDLLSNSAVIAKQANRANRYEWICGIHTKVIHALHPERFTA